MVGVAAVEAAVVVPATVLAEVGVVMTAGVVASPVVVGRRGTASGAAARGADAVAKDDVDICRCAVCCVLFVGAKLLMLFVLKNEEELV